jgi:hypothetical protein
LSLTAIAHRFPGILTADAICLTGSIAAGWGNAYSDVDIYAFSDHELELPIDDTMEMWPGSHSSGLRWLSWIGPYDQSRVDLTVWPTDAVATALEPLLGSTEPEYYEAGKALEDLIYRVSIAEPLKGDTLVDEMRRMIGRSGYRRVVARHSKFVAENALTDAAGQLESGDTMTALLSAMRAATFATDACLLLAGDLCKGEKWMFRRLERTPACGITLSEYRSMVLQTPKAGESDGAASLRLARWAQTHLVRVEDELLET